MYCLAGTGAACAAAAETCGIFCRDAGACGLPLGGGADRPSAGACAGCADGGAAGEAFGAGQAPANIFSMFNNADIRFPDAVDSAGNAHPLTQGNYIPMLKDSDRVLRRSAFTALYGVYAQYCNTLAATYYANAKQADIFAKQHKFAGAMEQALNANAIPMAVYENLVKPSVSICP